MSEKKAAKAAESTDQGAATAKAEAPSAEEEVKEPGTEQAAAEDPPAEESAEDATSEAAPAEPAEAPSKFPPVVDLAGMLQPIAGENPSGESLRYTGIYDEISEARRADDNLSQGVWQEELKSADYAKVIDLAVPAITGQSKDLQIAAYLSEALSKQHQLVGLRDSLNLVAGLQERFWDSLYPEIDEGDMEARANAIEWMVEQTALAVKEVPITQGAGFNFIDREDSRKYDVPDNLELLDSAEQEKYKALMAEAETGNRCTAEMWKKAISQSRRAFYEDLHIQFGECWNAYNKLNAIIEAKFDTNQMPGLGNLKKSLDSVETQVNKLLEIKRQEEPDPVDEDEASEEGGGGGRRSGSSSGRISSRKDALRRLAELARFFHQTEPHSPVSYLVNRAVKWGNMPLETWLQDVIKDESVLFQIRQTLGFNTNSPEDTADATEDAAAVSDETNTEA